MGQDLESGAFELAPGAPEHGLLSASHHPDDAIHAAAVGASLCHGYVVAKVSVDQRGLGEGWDGGRDDADVGREGGASDVGGVIYAVKDVSGDNLLENRDCGC